MMNTESLKRGRDRAFRSVESLSSDHGELDVMLANVIAAISNASNESSLYDVTRTTMKDASCLKLRRPFAFEALVSRIARAFATEHAMDCIESRPSGEDIADWQAGSSL